MIAAIIASAFAQSLATSQAAGSLDPTFGKGGKVAIAVALTPQMALAQPDGAILLSAFDAAGNVSVVRLTSRGNLDKTFGSGGIVALPMTAGGALAVQPDGKILIGGATASEAHAEVVRLRADGQLDASFGTGGTVTFDYVADSSNAALEIIVAPDGKIVAGGFGAAPGEDRDLTSLARFSANGSPDRTFGAAGIVAVDLVGGISAMGLQSDGKVLVCGGIFGPQPARVARFLADGNVDGNDAGGTLGAVAHAGSQTFDSGNAFQLDGKLLRWSSVEDGNGRRQSVKVSRFLRDGSADPHFSAMRFAFDAPPRNVPLDVEAAGNGALLVAGAASLDRYRGVFGLARLRDDGTFDPTFGKAGRLVTSFGGTDEATALAVEPDGKIVSAGIAIEGSTTVLVAARYLAN